MDPRDRKLLELAGWSILRHVGLCRSFGYVGPDGDQKIGIPDLSGDQSLAEQVADTLCRPWALSSCDDGFCASMAKDASGRGYDFTWGPHSPTRAEAIAEMLYGWLEEQD